MRKINIFKQLCLLICLLFFSQTAAIFSQTVEFLDSDFDKAKKAAAAQHKLIFIDFYTDWCKPCKMMSMEAFTDADIADKMNAFFINFKANAERGEGLSLKSKYGVQSYPTVMLLDSNGTILTQKSGYGGALAFSNFIDLIINQLPNGATFLAAQKKFNRGNRDFQLLLFYARLRKRMGLSVEPLTAAIIKDLPPDSLKNDNFQQFIMSYAYDLTGKTFDYILENRENPIYESRLKTLISQNFKNACKNDDKNHLKQILKANEKILSDSLAEEANLALTMEFYAETEQKSKKNYHKSASELITKYYLPHFERAKNEGKTEDLKKYEEKIEEVGAYYVAKISDKKYLQEIGALINRACEKHECSELLALYSQILYRAKEKEKALTLMQKAVSLSNDNKELASIFEKIKTGKF